MGADAAADELEAAALYRFAVNKSVVRLRSGGPLPPVLAETHSVLAGDGGIALRWFVSARRAGRQ